MGRDAGIAPAEHAMQPVFTEAGIAARAGLAFVAGAGGVVEIGAAGPLQQLDADGRGLAERPRSTCQQTLRKRRANSRAGAVARCVQRAPIHTPPWTRWSMRSSPGSRVTSPRRS